MVGVWGGECGDVGKKRGWNNCSYSSPSSPLAQFQFPPPPHPSQRPGGARGGAKLPVEAEGRAGTQDGTQTSEVPS